MNKIGIILFLEPEEEKGLRCFGQPLKIFYRKFAQHRDLSEIQKKRKMFTWMHQKWNFRVRNSFPLKSRADFFFQKRPQKEFEICFPRHFRVGGFTRQRGQKRLIGITATFSFHPSIIFTHGDEKTFFKRFFKVKNVLFSYLESLVLLCNWPSIFAAPKKYRTHSSHPSWGGKRNFHLPFSVKKRDRSFFSWLTPISTWKVQVGVFFAAFSSLTGYE